MRHFGALPGLLGKFKEAIQQYSLGATLDRESTPSNVVSEEVAAMHFIDTDEYIDNESDSENAQPRFDQVNQPMTDLTPEDETLLGIDPHHALPIY